MLDRAARLARLGTRLVSALAGLLMLVLLAFGGFALRQDAALRRGAFVGAELLQYKPAAPAADNPTLAELQAVNPDVCGWLTVDGTGIDYPVVQGATNMDYVNRDVYGDFSLSGAIFLDSRCAADLTDPYTVIYGHHMDNSAMFGDVARFAEADYFAAHPAGSISLPDAAYTIELFACVVTDAYDTAIYTPERYPDDVGALLDYAAAQAVQQRDIGVTAQDRNDLWQNGPAVLAARSGPAAGAALPAARGGCAGEHGDPRQCPHRRRGGGRRLYGGADAAGRGPRACAACPDRKKRRHRVFYGLCL